MAALPTVEPSSAPRTPEEQADPSFATTLAHGLDVLAAFRNRSGSLSNAELALHTGLSRPTVSRLTYTLAQLGYLKRDAKGRFELGLGILAAAYPVLSALKVRQLARPLMRDFAAYSGGTVSIAMPFGLDFIYVETLRTTDAVTHLPDVGFASSLAPTAVGRALLSLFTREELDAYVANVKAERPEEADYVQARTLPDVELCKERGFAISLGEWRREIFGVAAPLYRTAVGRLPFRQLRHSLVSFQRRADRARMRAAHARPRAQHPLAGGQRLNSPDRGARRIARTMRKIWGGKNEPDQNRAGLRRGFCFGRGHAARQCRAGAGQLPEPPIRIIVPYPAGGIVDIVARAVTEQVGRDWKQTVVVEARPGGNSNIGTSAVARSEPDGYTWLVTGPAALVNPTLYKDAGWDALKDLKCVGLAVWNQSVALVHPSMPASTIKEFVEIARKKPGELNFGNPGTGSSIDLSAQKLFQAANIRLTNMGYKGQPQALMT